jgi:site-specific DNA-cytosine methylase
MTQIIADPRARKNKGQLVNIVDLFCGGGLACGFDLHEGRLRYRTVLGLDNEPAAIRIFNKNFRPSASKALFGIGRLADVTGRQRHRGKHSDNRQRQAAPIAERGGARIRFDRGVNQRGKSGI